MMIVSVIGAVLAKLTVTKGNMAKTNEIPPTAEGGIQSVAGRFAASTPVFFRRGLCLFSHVLAQAIVFSWDTRRVLQTRFLLWVRP